VFAVAVADHQRTDLVTVLPLGDPVAALHNGTGTFQPRDVGSAGRHRVAAHALQAVGTVDTGGSDADQHLARFWFGHGTCGRNQHVGSTRLSDLDDSLGSGYV